MTLMFVVITLPKPVLPAELPQQIEAELVQWGEPLRWAIATISPTQIQVEAVVIQATDGEDLG